VELAALAALAALALVGKYLVEKRHILQLFSF
jgi:hypothetical protein